MKKTKFKIGDTVINDEMGVGVVKLIISNNREAQLNIEWDGTKIRTWLIEDEVEKQSSLGGKTCVIS